MDEEMKKRVGVFRYGVIADFVGGRSLSWGDVERLMREKCDQRWEIPGSMRTSISESTLKDWIQRYRDSGSKLESLYPQDRSDKGKSRALSEEVAAGIISLRKELPSATLPALLEEARSRKIIIPGEEFSYSALYRFLNQEGLVHGPELPPQDRRRFEAPSPNDLLQSDVLHGPPVPVEGKLRKTYLIAFLDDHSRLAAYGEFYLHEHLENFQDALRKTLLRRGLPRKLYVDNGAAQRSGHLAYICASLGIVLIHAKPYQPEGKGKIERWFRHVRGGFLSVHQFESLSDLNEKFILWCDKYNHSEHSITKESPIKRFSAGLHCVRPAPKDLEDHFRKPAKRTVAKDRTVALKGRFYEAPIELRGKQVTVLYHEHDLSRVEILREGKTHGFLVPLDVNVNCRVKRQQGITQIETDNTRYTGGCLFRKDNK